MNRFFYLKESWLVIPFTLGLMALALLVRLAIAPVDAGLQYVTFFPAVTVAAVFAGYRAGLLATLLGILLRVYVLTPPYHSFSMEAFTVSLWSNLVFLFDGVLLSLMIEAMHRYRERYQRELEDSRASGLREKQLNEDLNRLVGEYRRQEVELRKFEAIVSSSDDAIISKSLEGVIESWNPGAAKLFGYTSVETIGQKMQMLVPPDRANEEVDILARIARGLRVEHFETVRRCKYGQLLDISATISPILDVDGKVLGASNIARDISERRRFEARQEEAKRQLELQLAEISRLKNLLQEQVIRDPLTGLHNRRYFDETLPHELARARRKGYALSLVMLDLDHFKLVNDTYGHQAGDEVLKAFARILKERGRESDIFCRYGGEEIVVVLPGMSLAQSLQRVDAWRKELAATPVRFGDYSISITFSAGIAAFPEHGAELDALLGRADAALYLSKNTGRNCITLASAEHPQVA